MTLEPVQAVLAAQTLPRQPRRNLTKNGKLTKTAFTGLSAEWLAHPSTLRISGSKPLKTALLSLRLHSQTTGLSQTASLLLTQYSAGG
jgi:hypothetical protein